MDNDPAGDYSGIHENDFELVGNVCGTSDRDRSRCCLWQLNGFRSHKRARATRPYGNAGTHSNAHTGSYGHTRAQSYAHAGTYRYTGAQSTERIRRGGAYRNPEGYPASGC